MTTNSRLVRSPLLSPLENTGSVSLRDLIYHEDLDSMVQFNFLVDVDYLMSCTYRKDIPVIIIHGERNDNRPINMQAKKYPNVKAFTPVIKDRYGTHHTKAMILFFKNRQTEIQSAQIVIMTANMILQDWQLMTQGVYTTPRCTLKPKSNNVGDSLGTSPFERDFIKYLVTYNLPCLLPVISKLKSHDWSSCKAILVGSVPGYHRKSASTFSDWGLERLATVLRRNVDIPESASSSQLILQCSSMANSPEKWFMSLCSSMSESMNARAKRPNICVVYPTLKTATNSFTGREDSGGFLRFEQDSYDKMQSWLDPYLYDWKSRDIGRGSLMPHIKTYTRTYLDEDDRTLIAWHLLTSSNLSRAAWGEYQKDKTQIYIKSYELGVLFCPSLWKVNV
ncbi:unnamed protein product [Mucor hiemalis]